MSDELEQVESSQRQHYETMLFQSRQGVAVQAEEYNLFAMLKPKIYQDGKQWCVLYGENIQEGIAGFGETPLKAIWDWNAKWHTEI